ncbi:Uncharacterised protein [Legionella lansingensis]|uniref:Secreted protein n=1 Tax=Legionella lansingensis TaxID=45067 RepID=A0A0W0VTB0_9GAMM|nr:hypothetical protein [Legionella lansingensis]KTD23379.1 hypothetical protein Llan_0878 [Legionella lansingensis]SNV49460.1 Uncharacterised protein [Legionella lansingensis]
MKTITVSISSLFLMAFSFSSFADKVVISGPPVVLEDRGAVYYVPNTYTTTSSYHYVTIGGTNKICYAEAQPSLAALSSNVIEVNIGGRTVNWTCYPYDEAYFAVSP